MLYLVYQKMAGIQVIPGIIGSRVVAVIIKDVNGYLLLRKKNKQFTIKIHLTHCVDSLNIFDRNRAFISVFIMKENTVVLPLQCAVVKDVVLPFHVILHVTKLIVRTLLANF